MNKLGWSVLGIVLLGVCPVFAQQSGNDGASWRRTPQVVQGTIQTVVGSVATLLLPGQGQYGGQMLQIDVSRAAFEAPDGTPAAPQTLYPGERVIVSVRPSYDVEGYNYQDQAVQYTPPAAGTTPQYYPAYPATPAPAPMRATLVEPLSM